MLGPKLTHTLCAGRFPAQLPIWTVWLQSLLGIFGGGNIVAVSLMFVMLSDVTPASQT